jgi:SAM-dependent methyltransferase
MCPVCLSGLEAGSTRCPACGHDTAGRLTARGEVDAGRATLPPPDLVYRVMGMHDLDEFLFSGHRVAEDLARAAERSWLPIDRAASIFDFGTGCGRVLRWLVPKAPGSAWHACDIDEAAVGWVAENFPMVRGFHSDTLPPLPVDDASFDLVTCYSVFTHLPEDYQDAWLAELTRITRPGGVLIITVHGPTVFERAMSRSPDMKARHDEFEAGGLIYWANDFWKDEFPSYYQTSYHHPSYVRGHWSNWLEIVDILPGGAFPMHDVVIARRPPA